ncbi:MAG: 4-(cytidine 5'-diphospho)-2-C-methyl-D-erythritol kinase [Bacilli bacterium]
MEIFVKAPAKINLSLDVLRKREDGYHEVRMVMTTVDLADRIGLKRTDGKILVHSHNRFVPSDSRNLAFQAAELLKSRFNVPYGVEITIDKFIPVAAGLAGGSSDAAATLRGLNTLWDLGLTVDELATLGAEIGSDVSFCVYGGTALATGRGEKIHHLPSPPPFWVVLAKPEIGVSTQEVYGAVSVPNLEHPDVDAMITSIQEQDYDGICKTLGNSLENVTFSLYPEVKQLKEKMIAFGADAVLMSGSGPTVFGIVRHDSKLSRVYNGLKGFCPNVYAVRLLGTENSLIKGV